ncbi:hypothetical protein [Novosphingobium sp.]
MIEHIRKLATDSAMQGHGQIDLRNASSQAKEAADAARAAALEAQNKK